MTGIDSETSQAIAEAISLKGGRYLEAQIQGSDHVLLGNMTWACRGSM